MKLLQLIEHSHPHQVQVIHNLLLISSILTHSSLLPCHSFKNIIQGLAQWRSGYVRTFCFGGPGFAGRILGSDWHFLASHAVAGIPHIKWRKMGMDVSSGPVFLSKRGGLVADVSAGLIFLKKKVILSNCQGLEMKHCD